MEYLRHTLGAGNVGGALTYHAQSGFIPSTKCECTGCDGTQGSPSTWGGQEDSKFKVILGYTVR